MNDHWMIAVYSVSGHVFWWGNEAMTLPLCSLTSLRVKEVQEVLTSALHFGSLFLPKNYFFVTFAYYVCVWCTHTHTQACTLVPDRACLSQRTCRSSFSPSTLWIPGIELRSLGFAASPFTRCLTLQALVPFTASPRNAAGDEEPPHMWPALAELECVI